MNCPLLLAQPHLSVITRRDDLEIARIQDVIETKVLVDGRAELERALSELVESRQPARPKTLDLIGHSTATHSLLALGDFVIDTRNPTVSAFFRGLAENDVLPRLGVTALRLLGCRTADTAVGRATLRALGEMLELPVYGTTKLIYSAFYDRGGFAADRYYALISSAELAEAEAGRYEDRPIDPWPQVLDLDAIPAATPTIAHGAWPRYVATANQMGELLQHVSRRQGSQMPGLLSAPVCEVLFPGHAANTVRRAQVVLDGDFVRFYPRGETAPGVVWPVDDPHALLATIERLPRAHGLDASHAEMK